MLKGLLTGIVTVDIGEIFTDNPREARVIDDEYVYTPAKSHHAKIPTWVP